MGTLMYFPMGLENSPYRRLCGSNLLVEVHTINVQHDQMALREKREIEIILYLQAADTFLKDACSILGISKDSSLSVVTNTGCTALPALLNLKEVMISRQVTGIWNGRDELPVSMD